jgi:hypothetical protein
VVPDPNAPGYGYAKETSPDGVLTLLPLGSRLPPKIG